jgi:hypothetical protein
LEQELFIRSSVRDIDALIRLALRRRWACGKDWSKYMDGSERITRIEEQRFLLLNPEQGEFLNRLGLEKAKSWEQAFKRQNQQMGSGPDN